MVSTGGPFNEQFSLRSSIRRGGKKLCRKRSLTDAFKQSAVWLVVAEGDSFAAAKAVQIGEQSSFLQPMATRVIMASPPR
jgi:hypothetical protein